MLLHLFVLSLGAMAVDDKKKDVAYDPTSSYREQRLEGWLLRINQKLDAKENIELRDKMLRLLSTQLYQITRVLPAEPLEKVRKIPIWIELAHPKHPCMCYHVSKDWLKSNGMNPDKAGGVELANCKTFLSWTIQQPWMVFHELAHGYHHQILTYEHAGVRACYDEAKKAKLYESVLHINGQKQKHYALSNDREYFAEMSEAYFGTNDFFPFVKSELKEVDPRMYQLLEEVWEIRKKKR